MYFVLWWNTQCNLYSCLPTMQLLKLAPLFNSYSTHWNADTWSAIFTRGWFWPSVIFVACICMYVSLCLSVCQLLACPHDNSGPVQARITKFGQKMQNTLVKVPIVLWSDRPLTWKSKFTPFWACSHHNSSPIQARITKFDPDVQNNLIKFPIVLGGNWP